MIETGRAEAALGELRPLLEDDVFEADALNLMGYAYRKLGNFAGSREYYTRALTLDPRHKGALEYMGELELQTGDPVAARALLARLEAVFVRQAARSWTISARPLASMACRSAARARA